LDISCVILGGGRSLRLGRDKAQERVNGKSLLERVVSTLIAFKSDIIIVISKEQTLSEFEDHPELRVATDIYPGKGPLGGIYTALRMSNSFYNLVVACDMPFLNQDLLHYMISLAEDSDLVVPRLGSMVEPLHAVYSQNCLAPLEHMLKHGKLMVTELFSLVKVRYVEAEEINRFDPHHLSFFNINTRANLEKARELMRDGGFS